MDYGRPRTTALLTLAARGSLDRVAGLFEEVRQQLDKAEAARCPTVPTWCETVRTVDAIGRLRWADKWQRRAGEAAAAQPATPPKAPAEGVAA